MKEDKYIDPKWYIKDDHVHRIIVVVILASTVLTTFLYCGSFNFEKPKADYVYLIQTIIIISVVIVSFIRDYKKGVFSKEGGSMYDKRPVKDDN